MSSSTKLSEQDIQHIAHLANLNLTKEETATFQSQLTETLQYVKNLQELDIKEVTPTYHVTDLKNVGFEDGTECTRQFTPEEAVKNAKDSDGALFRVKRIME